MQGYWQDPQATAEVLKNGWLHTGDLGHVDPDGYVWITGRKKELIVTAAGKNIAPVLLESLLTEDPLIDQAVVIGDGRNYLTALIVLNWDQVRRELPALSKPQEHRDIRQEPALIERMRQCIDQRLSGLSHHEQVRRFHLMERPFSIEQGELTPKLSLRRGVIHEHFRGPIEAMYGK
jgi:long-chain acyl-CoA synthetase